MRRIESCAVLLVALVACKARPATSAEPASPRDAARSAEPASPRDAARSAEPSAARDATAQRDAPVIPAQTRQLITAITDDWAATTATLRLWTREGAAWTPVGEPWRAVVGRSGTAWGAGLHGRGAPAGREGPVKREGDGASPAGAFALTASFGYASAPPAGTTLPYQQVDARWKCVDDPASRAYNRVLDERSTAIDWTSAEDMRRADDHYAWVVEVAHNAARTPRDGSCIFLHVWGGPDAPTVGCTAMEEPRLAALIATLSPAAAPVYVLLPRAEYAALAPAWGLPH